MRTTAEAFDEWMRRYIEEPGRYEREFETVQRFVDEDGGASPTSYGQACAAYLQLLRDGREVEDLRAAPPEPARG